MTLEYPPHLLEAQPTERHRETLRWWTGLPELAQLDFLLMWDERAEDAACYGFVEEGRLVWEALPLELHGVFVEPDDAELSHDHIKRQLLEFINNHEDIEFFLVDGRFHICRAHAAARSVVRDGVLRHDFVCPLGEAACPMRAILGYAPGKSVRLGVRRARRGVLMTTGVEGL